MIRVKEQYLTVDNVDVSLIRLQIRKDCLVIETIDLQKGTKDAKDIDVDLFVDDGGKF